MRPGTIVNQICSGLLILTPILASSQSFEPYSATPGTPVEDDPSIPRAYAPAEPHTDSGAPSAPVRSAELHQSSERRNDSRAATPSNSSATAPDRAPSGSFNLNAAADICADALTEAKISCADFTIRPSGRSARAGMGGAATDYADATAAKAAACESSIDTCLSRCNGQARSVRANCSDCGSESLAVFRSTIKQCLAQRTMKDHYDNLARRAREVERRVADQNKSEEENPRNDGGRPGYGQTADAARNSPPTSIPLPSGSPGTPSNAAPSGMESAAGSPSTGGLPGAKPANVPASINRELASQPEKRKEETDGSSSRPMGSAMLERPGDSQSKPALPMAAFTPPTSGRTPADSGAPSQTGTTIIVNPGGNPNSAATRSGAAPAVTTNGQAAFGTGRSSGPDNRGTAWAKGGQAPSPINVTAPIAGAAQGRGNSSGTGVAGSPAVGMVGATWQPASLTATLDPRRQADRRRPQTDASLLNQRSLGQVDAAAGYSQRTRTEEPPMDLSEYLPTGRRYRAGRGPAGLEGERKGIQNRAVDIWGQITNRFHVACLDGRLRDCRLTRTSRLAP